MRRWGIILAACLAIILGSHAVAAGAGSANGDLPSIAVAGNRHIGADMIRSFFRPGPGGKLDAAALDAGLKRLYASGLFNDAKISRVGGRILVTVVENPTIGAISFEGNKKIKDADLKKVIQSKENGPLSRALVQGDVV